jgi:hypothetical protein
MTSKSNLFGTGVAFLNIPKVAFFALCLVPLDDEQVGIGIAKVDEQNGNFGRREYENPISQCTKFSVEF